ncbi:hypothetical protein F0P96_16985 [Hymenobacter busanensis]|uniref:Uncharacterized protein n=1 Tax=Hymenobacter busanensis TaxID=2607656 RepID=A0A7L4ZSE0_9BACT|nr:hypothetical protein [Hymenobacter busanensis]KAA9327672.1 hypothetical protein F0P96_16985 [Hymenobacter busanensis]QHJ05988.1 hypothetical protein GUY19_01245 [Hymenobacter busanensis]
MLYLIGLAGKRGSGKDTVAHLVQQLEPARDWQIRSFGDAIKGVCAVLTGETTAPYYTQPGKAELAPTYGLTRGEMLQQVGAALRAWRGPVWIEALLANLPADHPVVVADIRFPDEADALRARGGVIWRVEGDPLQQRGDGTRDDNHPSETAMDEYAAYAAVLRNAGSLDELQKRVAELLTAGKS